MARSTSSISPPASLLTGFSRAPSRGRRGGARGLDRGIGLGRIWRIVPDGAPRAKFDIGLSRASNGELVQRLGDGNGWGGGTAQRLLVEKRDPQATPPLRAAALDRAKPAVARLHALWTLDGVGDGALDRAT